MLVFKGHCDAVTDDWPALARLFLGSSECVGSPRHDDASDAEVGCVPDKEVTEK